MVIQITISDQRPAIDLPEQGCDFRTLVERIQISLIKQALARTFGNKARAATLLKMKRTQLVSRMRIIGMPLNRPTRIRKTEWNTSLNPGTTSLGPSA